MNGNAYSPLALMFVVWIVIIFAVVGLIPYWKIFSKAGFSGWLSLLMMVPLVNLLVLYLVAFSNWNVQPTSYQQQVPPPPVLPGQQRWR